MDLRLVWLICRSDSQLAKAEANQCAKELEKIGCKVTISENGPAIDPNTGRAALPAE